MTAEHVRDSVVCCQSLVQEGCVCAQQIERAAIFSQHTFEQQLSLATKSVSQVVVEIGKQPAIRLKRIQISQVQPLSSEVAHQ